MAVDPMFSARRARKRDRTLRYCARIKRGLLVSWKIPALGMLKGIDEAKVTSRKSERLYQLVIHKTLKRNQTYLRGCSYCRLGLQASQRRAARYYEFEELEGIEPGLWHRFDYRGKG